MQTNSNTTNVKVKHNINDTDITANSYSNTTNVKVKLERSQRGIVFLVYSNTTNVKVKRKPKSLAITGFLSAFKYNQC